MATQPTKLLSSLRLRHKAEKEAADLPALQAAAEKAATSILAGDHAQRKPGMGEKFWQFREYDPADRPQDIDWRMSARTDRLFVKQKEWQTTQTALFWTQHSESMDFRSNKNLVSKQENAITLSLGMALLLTHGHEKIGLLSGNMTAGRTENSLQTLGEQLCREQTGPRPEVDIEKTPKNANIILIGDFLAPLEEIEKSFSMIAGRSKNGIVFQVLDPAELTLPYEGRYIFEDKGPRQHHIQNVSSVRIQYQQRINAHIEDIRKLCRKHQWQWLLHRTDIPVRETLFDAWAMTTRNIGPGGDA